MEGLVAVLAEGVRDGAPIRVGVSGLDEDTVGLHLQPASSADPVGGLAGWRAPAGWLAAGLAAPAMVIERGRAAGSATAVVARPDGTLVVGVAGTGRSRAWTTPAGAGEGRLADLCRRVMGVATPPCPDPPRSAWAAAWLDRLVAGAARRSPRAGPLSWPDVAAAHPIASGLTPGGARSPEQLAGAAALPLARRSWEELRRAVAAGHPQVADLAGDLSPGEAAWHDAGSFGRQLLARQPPPEELLDALADLLPPALFGHVARVAAAWGVVGPTVRGPNGSR